MQRTFEDGRARLFQADGSRLSSDLAHEEQPAALRGERDAVLEEVQEDTRSIIQGGTPRSPTSRTATPGAAHAQRARKGATMILALASASASRSASP